MRNALLLFSKTIITLFCIGWLSKNLIVPVSAYLFMKEDFKNLSASCAIAMDNSWYIRQETRIDKSIEISELLICHDYDKKRKLLLLLGVPESALSYLGLIALERDQVPAEMLIENHRLNER